MYQNKNKNSGTKRAGTFLSEDVRKQFGCCVKKPRLDVRLTPLSPHSPNKTSQNNNGKDAADEIWGEELPEEAIEECELLATQAYEEAWKGENDNIVAVKPKEVVRYNPSTSRSTSNGHFKGTDCSSNTSSFSNQKNRGKLTSRSEDTEISNTVNNSFTRSVSAVAQQHNKKIENENKELKEKFMQKEGENAILRSQLEQLRLQLKTQKLEHMKSLESQSQKFTKMLNEQKKELDVTNTQLQFQIMEATSMRNHCKVLESGSKIKLIEPKSIGVETPKFKKEIQRQEDQRRNPVSNSGIPSPNSRNRKLNDRSSGTLIKQVKPIGFGIREGAVLGLLVNEYLTAKSEPDISWILYLRKKQSHCRKIKEAEGINSKILKLQKCSATLESCYTAVNKLITLDAVSSTVSYFFVETIVKECQKIVCRQMHVFHLLCGVQSYTERGTLNGVVASAIGTSATKINCHLMSARRWYDEEEGVESRRALGLLCSLCDVSKLASELTYGLKPLSSSHEDLMSKLCSPNRNKTVIATTSKFVCEDLLEECDNKGQGISMIQKKDKIPYNEYLTKPFGLLHLLRDIALSISFQRRTRHFVGLLTGIVKLLSVVARRTTLTSEGLDLMKDIIREVVFCRPQLEVVVALFELLASVANYSLVMKSLCINSGNKTFVDMKLIGLTYFTRDSCVTQVLFKLLPVSTSSVSLRTELCYHMVNWLHSAVCFSGKESCWLLAFQENRKVTCNCREMLASGLVTTLYNSLCDLDNFVVENSTKWKLVVSLKKSIILLRVWQQQDEEYWKYFGKENYAYQLWLAKIKTYIKNLGLNELEKDCLGELFGKPEESNDVTAVTEDEDVEYWDIVSKDSKVLFTDQK